MYVCTFPLITAPTFWAKYKEIRGGARLLHSTVANSFSHDPKTCEMVRSFKVKLNGGYNCTCCLIKNGVKIHCCDGNKLLMR